MIPIQVFLPFQLLQYPGLNLDLLPWRTMALLPCGTGEAEASSGCSAKPYRLPTYSPGVRHGVAGFNVTRQVGCGAIIPKSSSLCCERRALWMSCKGYHSSRRQPAIAAATIRLLPFRSQEGMRGGPFLIRLETDYPDPQPGVPGELRNA